MADNKDVIVVTGSSGFIGKAVCAAFVKDGFQVVGLDRPEAGSPPIGIEHITADVTSDESMTAAASRVRDTFGDRVASVIHLAAYYDFSGEPSSLYDEVTVRGTERLLRTIRPLEVGQFVFSSTMLVHAPCQPGKYIDESSPLDAKWEYPDSKVRAERIISAERGKVPAVMLRIAGVYTDRCESIPLAHQIQRIYERRLTSKVFPGDTSTGQSYVHLEDLVEAFRSVVARRFLLFPETVILLGEPEPMSYDELQRTLAKLIHGEDDWTTTQIPKAVAKAGAWVQDKIPGIEEPFIKPWMIDLADDHYALNLSRAWTLLNWQPRRALRETLPRMVEALEADPAGWYRANKLEPVPEVREAPAATGPQL